MLELIYLTAPFLKQSEQKFWIFGFKLCKETDYV
jgi:hypothetical protein